MLLYFSWLIALIGFCVSIFFGEILGNTPCFLCWYQRMALFPLVILLGMGAYRGNGEIIPYAIPFAGLGGMIALFHLLQPFVPLLQGAHLCRGGVSCTDAVFTWGGFNGLPLLSTLGFFSIAFLLRAAQRQGRAATRDC